jgi:hypothetical protein
MHQRIGITRKLKIFKKKKLRKLNQTTADCPSGTQSRRFSLSTSLTFLSLVKLLQVENLQDYNS